MNQYEYTPTGAYVCSLQVIDPYVRGLSNYAKLLLPPSKCYKVRPILETMVKNEMNDRLFLDYSKRYGSIQNIQQAKDNSELNNRQLLYMLEARRDYLEKPTLYTRKLNPKYAAASTIQRFVKNRVYPPSEQEPLPYKPSNLYNRVNKRANWVKKQRRKQFLADRPPRMAQTRRYKRGPRRNINLKPTKNPRGAGRPSGTYKNLGLYSMGY